MKKIISFILCLATAAAAISYCAGADSFAQSDSVKIIDNIVYQKSSPTETHTYYSVVSLANIPGKSKTKIKILNEIGGVPVECVGSLGEQAVSIGLKDSTIKEITVPDSVKYMGEYCFTSMNSLEKITLSKNLEYISMQAFKDCKKLKKVIFKGKIKSIGEMAFKNCVSLKSIALPSSLKKLGAEAFRNSGLVSITVPKNTKLNSGESEYCEGGFTFADCKSLKKAVFKNKNIFLQDYEFANCKRLEKICYYSDAVLNIYGNCVFKNCKSLKEITLSKNTKRISKNAFYGCSGLAKVTVKGSAPKVEKNAFKNTKKSIKFVVKDKKSAVQLRKNLKGSGVKNARIYLGKKLISKNIK